MSISNYTDLTTEVKAFLKKPRLENKVDLYIFQVESDINREARVPQMECRKLAEVNQLKIALPTDMLELRDITADGPSGKYSLQLITPEMLNEQSLGQSAGLPTYYTIEDEAIKLDNTSGDEGIVEILYYQEVPALSATNETNWLINDFPMVYWYGCLLRGSEWARDDVLIQRYAGAYGAEIKSLKRAGAMLSHGGQGMRMVAR